MSKNCTLLAHFWKKNFKVTRYSFWKSADLVFSASNPFCHKNLDSRTWVLFKAFFWNLPKFHVLGFEFFCSFVSNYINSIYFRLYDLQFFFFQIFHESSFSFARSLHLKRIWIELNKNREFLRSAIFDKQNKLALTQHQYWWKFTESLTFFAQVCFLAW